MQEKTPTPAPIPDPSATLPVNLDAAAFMARAREDALSRALIDEEPVPRSVPRSPAPRGARAWDPDTGTWTEAEDEVRDPSWVDADSLTRDRDDTPFSFPTWVSDDSLVAHAPVDLPVEPPALPPTAGAPRIVAASALAGVVVVLIAWFALG